MATENVVPFTQYEGNGVANQFSVQFPYLDRSFISLYVKKVNELEEKLTDNDFEFVSDEIIKYPLEGELLQTGEILTIKRETPVESDYVFDNNKRLFPVEVMKADDLGFQILQELKEDLKRTVSLTPTETITPDEIISEINEKVLSAESFSIVSQENSNNSHIWAEGTEEEVAILGGEKSAKGWAEETNGKLELYNQNATEKTLDFNNLASEKTIIVEGLTTRAETAATSSEANKTAVEQYRNEVEGFATEVEENRTLAQSAANSASSDADDASSARVGAETAQGITQGYEASARVSAQTASDRATVAEIKAMEAGASAINAKSSEDLAKTYVDSINPDEFANIDLSNITPLVQRIVAEYFSGDSFYIIYERPQSDGSVKYWCEQGDANNAGLGTETAASVSFRVPFIDTNYTALVTTQNFAVTSLSAFAWVRSKSASSMTVKKSVSDSIAFSWRACGYCNKP